jgi:hypothetical protein
MAPAAKTSDPTIATSVFDMGLYELDIDSICIKEGGSVAKLHAQSQPSTP